MVVGEEEEGKEGEEGGEGGGGAEVSKTGGDINESKEGWRGECREKSEGQA